MCVQNSYSVGKNEFANRYFWRSWWDFKSCNNYLATFIIWTHYHDQRSQATSSKRFDLWSPETIQTWTFLVWQDNRKLQLQVSEDSVSIEKIYNGFNCTIVQEFDVSQIGKSLSESQRIGIGFIFSTSYKLWEKKWP